MVENNEIKPQEDILDSSAAEKASETIDVEKILEKYDRESASRTLSTFWQNVVRFVCIAFSLFQLYTAAFGVFEAQIQRAIHLGFALVLVYLLYPARLSKRKEGVKWLDVLFALLGLAVGAYVVVEYTDLMMRAGLPTTGDIVFGALCILLVLEASRRVVGIPITIVAMFFLAYAYWGPYFPGMFAHRGFSYTRIITHMYVTTEGILGMPVGVAATFVYMFILFGAFLHKTGLGKFFIDLALAATGHRIGGPAKVAVLASGFFGTISGSSVANTVTTGTFTIPLMKSIGYKPEFAGAVEAAASTGGQLMPPIMGAAAFVMSQFIGIAYIEIAIAAALPALLYYLAVGFMVHMEAKRLGLQGIPKDRLPNLKKVLSEGWHLLLPLFVIVYLLVKGYTPLRAALVCIVVTVAIAMMKKSTRLNVKDILDALESGARSAIGVSAACACAGIIIGVVTLTGVGLKIANGIVVLSGGSFFLTLFLTMIASIILGMGLPTTAKYIVLASMAAPAIMKFGVPIMAAHLFIFYFGIVADLTPPVALVSYAAAGIAQSNPMKTGFTGLRLAMAGFLIPYIFVYNPGILLIDTTPLDVVLIAATSILGAFSLALAGSGFWMRPLNIIERLVLFGSAISLIFPGTLTDIGGAVVLAGIWFLQKQGLKRDALK
ncbi:TRAP transporter 4TM/12TM fusion protein [Aminivibrio pyruvatiphilus]|uniref:TRAP transporter 4TM/12TM fusion protein n=1 Tax=Aminivibrio pyruvatiphilus TaxID=1005740 RepID=A0A4R8MGD0_9BACT|nr:TRAP transporter permease [Aminivibrio pyruvatiphilus]TDY64980.1 TRAP transporter 4TM/12TM fusion protein [Aminivibrio pyruvatiphilus]